MTSRTRHIHFGQFITSLKDLWFVHLIQLAIAIGAGFGLRELADVSAGHAYLFGALIFLILEGYALFEVVSGIGDDLASLTGHGRECTIVVGPHHAKLQAKDNGWTSDGVVWLGLAADVGSQVEVSVQFPAGVSVTWVNRESHPMVWDFLGEDGQGRTTYKLSIERAETRITTLGQFALRAENDWKFGVSILVAASGKTAAGVSLDHKATIGILQDASTDVHMKSV